MFIQYLVDKTSFFRSLHWHRNATHFILNNGRKMPIICFGTHKKRDRTPLKSDQVQRNVERAIKEGFRAFDCAPLYGTEAALGNAIANSNIKREDLFIITKIGPENFGLENVEPALESSLEKLGLTYVDLYLLQYPCSLGGRDYLETWSGMEDCVDRGLARSIGVSNFNLFHLDRLIGHCTMMPAVNQIEVHVHFNQHELIQACKERGIVPMGYRPLYTRSLDYKPEKSKLVDLPEPILVNELARKHRKTDAQIRLRFLIDSGAALIVSSSDPRHMKENLKVTQFHLDAADMRELSKLDSEFRTNSLPASPGLSRKPTPKIIVSPPS